MNMQSGIDEFRAQFDKVHLENLLLDIERTLTSNSDEKVDVVQEYFRTIHSLKGAAGTLKLTEINRFLHAYEDALGMLAQDVRRITGIRNTEIFDFFLQGLDLIDRLVELQKMDGAVLKDEGQLLPFYIRMVLGGRQMIDQESDFFELADLDEELF